jgi:hypothetical protein
VESPEVANPVAGATDSGPTPSSLEAFAEDLGHLLGAARAKADSWLEQRQQVVEQLTGIRDTAVELLDRLGVEAARATQRVRGLAGGAAQPATASEVAPAPRRTRRRLSAAARARISAAQKARWARVRKAAK